MDGLERADETPAKSTPAGYFFAIIAVLGGTLLMPPFSFVFTMTGALLLLGLALVLYKVRRVPRRGKGKMGGIWPAATPSRARAIPISIRTEEHLFPGTSSCKPIENNFGHMRDLA